MARITVEDCLDKVESQYDLVLLAKERTSQLNAGDQPLVPEDNDKNTVIALREIGAGKVDTTELRKNAVLRLRKEPNESAQEEVEEEISNDDFEKQYNSLPLQGPVNISEICAAVKFILECPSMTGQLITIDGGQHLGWAQPGQQIFDEE